MLQAARCKYKTQKSRQKSPSGHHRTTLSGYIFANKARIDNRKKIVKQQYRAVATFEATEAAASVVFTTLASMKTIISTTLNIKYEAHDCIAETHNGNCDRLSSSFKRRCSYALI